MRVFVNCSFSHTMARQATISKHKSHATSTSQATILRCLNVQRTASWATHVCIRTTWCLTKSACLYVTFVPYVMFPTTMGDSWRGPKTNCVDPNSMLVKKYVYIYIYIYINRYPISYIQYGNIPIRDSPHPTPPHAVGTADRAGGGGRHWVGWGGESLMGIFPDWI